MALRSKIALKQIVEIADEISSAVAAEAALREAADDTLTADLAAEVTRATGAEATLTSDLADEVTRAMAAETVLTGDLSTEVTRATTAEGLIASDLADEVTRAMAAEGVLTTAIETEQGRIDAILAGADVDLNTFTEVVNLINSIDLENDDSLTAHLLAYDTKIAELETADADLENLVIAESGRRYDDDVLVLAHIGTLSESFTVIAGDAIVGGEYTVTLPVGKVLSNHRKVTVVANGATLFPASSAGAVGTSGDYHWDANTSLLTFEDALWDSTDVLMITLGVKSAAPTLTP